MNVWLVSETEIWGDRRKPRVAAETPALAYAWLAENCRGNDNFDVEQVEFLSDVEPDSWDFVRPDGAGERAWLHRSPIECFRAGDGPFRIGSGTVTISGWISGGADCICPTSCTVTGTPALLKEFADTYSIRLTRVGAEVET